MSNLRIHNRVRIFNRFLLAALLTSSISAKAGPEILAAYVLFGQSEAGTTVPMLRIIVDGVNSDCPSLQNLGSTQAVELSMSPRINPDPLNFPITVCEAKYHTDMAGSMAGSTFVLPKVTSDVANVAIFGDSGCKESDQTCEATSPTWPFANLAKQAASATPLPDVVLHMGDYNYRGTPGSIKIKGLQKKVSVYDAGDNTTQGLCQIPGGYYGQNSPGSESPDSWSNWQADFFTPAKPLLAAAPWIFARGNHELCSRAGPGWFYLLDSNSGLLGKYAKQLHCPQAGNAQPLVLSPPYLVNLGSLDVVVLDSANACDSGLLNSDSYVNQFTMVQGLINNADGNKKQTWLQTHRPLWGVDKLDTGGKCGPQGSDKYCYVNQTLQYANRQSPLPSEVDLVVSGHMHRFQVVGFSTDHPQQLIVGNSGVELATTHPKKAAELMIDGTEATVMGTSEFGYMSIDVGQNYWTGTLLNASPPVSCDSRKPKICPPTKKK